MKKICIVLLLLMCAGVAKGEVVVSVSADYTFISPELVRDTFTLTFKNMDENTTFLSLELPMQLIVENFSVKDIPAGHLSYDVKTLNGGKILLLRISKPLSPFEEYKVVLEGNVRGLTDTLGNGMYRFTAVEYPEYFNSIGIPVDSIHISVVFPQKFLYTYRVTSVSSNSQIFYSPYNSVQKVEWDFVNPKSQVVAFIQFEEILNFMTLNILGASMVFGAFLILLYMSYRSEKKYKQMKVLVGTPWGGDIVSKLREMLGKAKEEILITSPHIYYTDWLTAELKPAIDRGVRVRIITWPSYDRKPFRSVEEVYEDKKQYFTLKRFLEMFPQGTVRLNDNIHAKMAVVDGKEVLITTANLTQTGLWENYEIGFWADNEELAKQAKSFFETVWNSEDTIELDEDTLEPKIAWAEIMDRKRKREVKE
ncbi:phospholipase D family protein [Archaeoglobus veneficus]|uniref:phospholipase D family protein n=1 Tax=Archaeoglobus veneficus TaxID=58290 RepID=UPI00064F55C2|nr:phospholipase D family protein [Archaeoglobus veneficus]